MVDRNEVIIRDWPSNVLGTKSPKSDLGGTAIRLEVGGSAYRPNRFKTARLVEAIGG